MASKKEIARRKTQAEDEYKKTVEGINLKYDEQIAAIEAEANEYKLQLAEYDTAKIESAKEQEKLLNSERQVQELERKKLIKEYEDRLSAVNADLTEYKETSNKRMKNSVTEVAKKYQAEMKHTLEKQENLYIKQAEVTKVSTTTTIEDLEKRYPKRNSRLY